jgi:hypothetical protein
MMKYLLILPLFLALFLSCTKKYVGVGPEREKQVIEMVLGEWALYLDTPNTLLTFYNNKKIRYVLINQNGDTSVNQMGSYRVEGTRRITVDLNDRERLAFEITDVDNAKKLRLKRDNKDYDFFKVNK